MAGVEAIRLGLKIWSTNLFYVEPARELYRRKIFDYIELYAVPGSASSCIGAWSRMGIPFCLHAPHAYSGFNLAKWHQVEENRTLLDELRLFVESLQPAYVIFHPGIEGTAQETIRQIGVFRKTHDDVFCRALLENKPFLGIHGEICIGASPEEVSLLLKETGLQFCLDMGHALAYAAWAKRNPDVVLDEFLTLRPKMFHLADGDRDSFVDQHRNLGRGNYDIGGMLQRIPPGACLTLEAEKTPHLSLR
ncbi:MAG TPA: TIM barrel protein, partial [Syntrophales bacterium]|nr:TIM barrel protein [Syntrophales bacterium]